MPKPVPTTGDPILDKFVELKEGTLIPEDLTPQDKLYRAFKIWWGNVSKTECIPSNKQHAKDISTLVRIQKNILVNMVSITSAEKRVTSCVTELTRLLKDMESRREMVKGKLKSFTAGFVRQLSESQSGIKDISDLEEMDSLVKRLYLLKTLKDRFKIIEATVIDTIGESLDSLMTEAQETLMLVQQRRAQLEETADNVLRLPSREAASN